MMANRHECSDAQDDGALGFACSLSREGLSRGARTRVGHHGSLVVMGLVGMSRRRVGFTPFLKILRGISGDVVASCPRNFGEPVAW